jgi:hypothetical protein
MHDNNRNTMEAAAVISCDRAADVDCNNTHNYRERKRLAFREMQINLPHVALKILEEVRKKKELGKQKISYCYSIIFVIIPAAVLASAAATTNVNTEGRRSLTESSIYFSDALALIGCIYHKLAETVYTILL